MLFVRFAIELIIFVLIALYFRDRSTKDPKVPKCLRKQRLLQAIKKHAKRGHDNG